MKKGDYKERISKWPDIKKRLDNNWKILDISFDLKISTNAIYAYMKRHNYERK
jgi:hypothetical protein